MAANNLTYQFKTANALIKLIVINVAAFLVFSIIPWVFQINNYIFQEWFVLKANLGELIIQPWSLITYSFLHDGLWHILGNMLFLYYFGRIVLNLFKEKRLMTIYFLGVLAGAVVFVLAYNLFPVFQNSQGFLIGASAGVMAVVIFVATYTPNAEIRIFFFNVKLWQVGVFMVLLDLLRLSGSLNAGGLLSHMGGAVFGYTYAQQLAKGDDIGLWWENLLATVSGYFTKSEKKSKMKTVYRNTARNKSTTTSSSLSKSEKQKQIDAILDKISKSGYESLSKAEKDFLFQSGKEN
ncbi:MAG: rhomboid family intramembrane serine protease [Leeuwenhoekiella sp.]